MTERRIERLWWLQAVAEGRCSAVTAASPAVYLMTLSFFLSLCLSFTPRPIFSIHLEFENRGWHETVRVPDYKTTPPPILFSFSVGLHTGGKDEYSRSAERAHLLAGVGPLRGRIHQVPVCQALCNR